MSRREETGRSLAQDAALMRRRRIVETAATMGLILVCVGMIAPIVSMDNSTLGDIFKWVYTGGAVVYIVARLVKVGAPGDSLRVRRIRRMEVWSGVCFCVGAAFWFYNSARFGAYGITLGILRDTILFTLAGALIQNISSWMLVFALRKQHKDSVR